jgi:hypothetical protein
MWAVGGTEAGRARPIEDRWGGSRPDVDPSWIAHDPKASWLGPMVLPTDLTGPPTHQVGPPTRHIGRSTDCVGPAMSEWGWTADPVWPRVARRVGLELSSFALTRGRRRRTLTHLATGVRPAKERDIHNLRRRDCEGPAGRSNRLSTDHPQPVSFRASIRSRARVDQANDASVSARSSTCLPIDFFVVRLVVGTNLA